MVSRYRGDPNYAAETRLFTLDGRVVDVLYTASRVGQVGEPGMSLLGVIDITERKQAEEALRRPERAALSASLSQPASRAVADQLAALRSRCSRTCAHGVDRFGGLHG